MLFLTNRAINEKLTKTVETGRKISFDLDNNAGCKDVYFCRKNNENDYVELGSQSFMQALKDSKAQQILLLVHGFSNMPNDVFKRADTLQQLFDNKQKDLVEVVPIIWPCDNDIGIIKDYWDDQKSADHSAASFARAFEMFMHWQQDPDNQDTPCLKRINIIAHSMGARVLRETLNSWNKNNLFNGVPLLFRNTFLIAADIVNESLEHQHLGKLICDASRNVSVYYASDDLALRSSKISNLKNKVASRRLGHSGPENMKNTPENKVYAIDCDDFNIRYDMPKGHSYFLTNNKGEAGRVFKHLYQSITTGRVQVDDTKNRRHIL